MTGYAGGHIARELLTRGYRVSGVARTRPADIDPRIRFHAGSLLDLELAERVLSGADVAVLAVRASKVAAEGTTFADAVKSLFPFVVHSGARLAVVGGAGSLRIPGTAMLHLERPNYSDAELPDSRNLTEARDQAAALSTLRASDAGLNWFYLSPPAVFGSYAPGNRTGGYRLGTDELISDENGKSHISGEDYAIALVDEIERPRHRNRRFTVAH